MATNQFHWDISLILFPVIYRLCKLISINKVIYYCWKFPCGLKHNTDDQREKTYQDRKIKKYIRIKNHLLININIFNI